MINIQLRDKLTIYGSLDFALELLELGRSFKNKKQYDTSKKYLKSAERELKSIEKVIDQI